MGEAVDDVQVVNVTRTNCDSDLIRRQRILLKKARQLLKVDITYRELECGRLLMIGYPVGSIARILNISQRTAEFYIGSLKLKCDCDNRWQLSSFLQRRLSITIYSTIDMTLLNREDLDAKFVHPQGSGLSE